MNNFVKNLVIKILTWQAMHLIGRFQPRIISVTGSVGKTSTKEAIYTFISSKFRVRKSEKSFNSEIGVPLTILGLPTSWSNPVKWIWNLTKGFWIAFFSQNYPEILVLEVGADKPGDIGNIVSWISPDIAVVTALASVPVHVENFPSAQAVYDEKAKLVEALGEEGVAVLNADDERVMKMASMTGAKVVTFGIREIDSVEVPDFMNPYPVLAGAKVAEVLGIPAEEIRKLSKRVEASPGRMNKLPGINNSIIIDDTYNSSPIALESALETLGKVQTNGKKIVVLGDMLELGEWSEAEHRRMGRLSLGIADSLVVVGERAKWIFDEAKEKRAENSKLRDFKICEDATLAGIYLKNIIKEGDVVLVKGSQSMRMEKTVGEIIDDPVNNKKFLVRQEKEWRGR